MREKINQHKIPALLLAILIAVLYFFFLRTQTAKALTQQATALQQEIATLPEPSAYKRPGMSATFSWIHSIPDFLNDLTQWAKKRSVLIVSIEPGIPIKQTGYTEQPVKLAIQGRFREVGDYLTFLEDLPRPALVTGIQLTSPTAIFPDLAANLDLVIYIKDAP